jgi:hypothetical protein
MIGMAVRRPSPTHLKQGKNRQQISRNPHESSKLTKVISGHQTQNEGAAGFPTAVHLETNGAAGFPAAPWHCHPSAKGGVWCSDNHDLDRGHQRLRAVNEAMRHWITSFQLVEQEL